MVLAGWILVYLSLERLSLPTPSLKSPLKSPSGTSGTDETFHDSNAVGEALSRCPLLRRSTKAEPASTGVSGLVSDLEEQVSAGAVEGAVSRLPLGASIKGKTPPPEEAIARVKHHPFLYQEGPPASDSCSE